MPTYIEMPKLADTMTEGTLIKWKKKEGDAVKMGDVLAEVETDKATMEMESFDTGVVHKLLVAEGQKVPIGEKIAIVLTKGEAPPAEGEAPATTAAPQKTQTVETASGSAQATAPSGSATAQRQESSRSISTEPTSTSPVRAAGERVRISPLARKLAEEKGIDFSALKGSGPGGRIVAKDLNGAAAGGGRSNPSQAAPAPAQGTGNVAAHVNVPLPVPIGENDKRIALSGMRRVIAERLLASKTQIPHFYLHIEVDAGPLMKLRKTLNDANEAAGGPKLTVNDFVLRAVVAAAVKVPAVNASFAGDHIVQYSAINLSVAVAVDEGLVTPTIREAEKKSLGQISEAVKDLATRARNKKLKPDEYQGGTVTVSNLGSYGVEFFDAIINPPQSIIVSVGAIVKKPVVGANDQIVAGQRMAIGLSADHRVVDGAIGAQYLAELRRLLEAPTLMLI